LLAFGPVAARNQLPKRLIDTRVATAGFIKPIEPSQDFSIPVHGVTVQIDNRQEVIPKSAKAVAITVTIVAPVTSGFLAVLTSIEANVIVDFAGLFIGDVEEAFVKIHPTRVIAENLSLSQ
jgi:hypothetical protein